MEEKAHHAAASEPTLAGPPEISRELAGQLPAKTSSLQRQGTCAASFCQTVFAELDMKDHAETGNFWPRGPTVTALWKSQDGTRAKGSKVKFADPAGGFLSGMLLSNANLIASLP